MMADDNKPAWEPQPMLITIVDGGKTFQVYDAQRWVEERKALLRRARDILTEYKGTPVSLYKHHGTLIGIARRLAEIKQIFDSFNRERNRHASANITALVAYFSDPKTMEGIDD